MSNTAIFILIAVAVIGAIFWLVIYAGRRGEKHRERTSIKPTEPPRERQAGWYFRLLSYRAGPNKTQFEMS